MTLLQRLNFQNGLALQLSRGTNRVVYTAAGNSIAAARVTNPNDIIEHKLYWMALPNKDAALYVTAILNAPEITSRISHYQSRGLFGARDIDKLVWDLPIPASNKSLSLTPI